LLTIYKALHNTLSSDKILSQKPYFGIFGHIMNYSDNPLNSTQICAYFPHLCILCKRLYLSSTNCQTSHPWCPGTPKYIRHGASDLLIITITKKTGQHW